MRILTVNAGSSSLKLSLLDHDDSTLAQVGLEVGSGGREGEELAAAVERIPVPDAIGHRFVHGGRDFTQPVVIDEHVTKRLHALTDLAPLHQPHSLYGLGEVTRALPEVPAVACFDTAFHATLPETAATYAIPAEWRERYGIRRYGFHGLSHAYAVRRTGRLLDTDPAALRIVVCHLGAGASLAAVTNSRSVDTTMGFTPLEGLVMATRSGTIDPGIIPWLIEHGLSARQIADDLEHRSGLAALAGTPDMRQIQTQADAGESAASLALEVYLHHLRAGIAAMTATLGGLDVLVFTGGVGEHSPQVRRRTAQNLAYLGVAIDDNLNNKATIDTDLTAKDANVRTLLIKAREDLEIANGVRNALA